MKLITPIIVYFAKVFGNPICMLKRFLLLLLIIPIFCFESYSQISFGFNAQYLYLKGSDAATLPGNWMTSVYNAAGWNIANAPFRYGDGTGGTELTDMQNNYPTLYLRSTFVAQNVGELETITINVDYDDGFIIWINGEEATRRFAPENPTYNSFSTDLHESGLVETIKIKVEDIPLKEGDNLIAVQGFNYNLESSDFYFDMQIAAKINLPEEAADTAKALFSTTGGFFSAPFQLTVSVPDNTYNLFYTIDGSNPQTSSTALNGGKSKTISINPTSTAGRPKTPAYIVRASLLKPGEIPTKPFTQTYIFLDEVLTQKHPGGKWPTSNVNGQIIDLEMDSRVTTSSLYRSQMHDALKDIPSISIVTDNESLFDAKNGIYVNAWGHGYEWERFCSVELLDPKSNIGFNVNAGLRIRGGWSRHNDFPKHAFRLFFRSEYGDAKLNYPLFGTEGVDQFDKVDLRTAQNYAWSNGQTRNTMVREVFSRDSQRDMGQPYTRSRYYHLYLNGMYWGIFQTQERSEARFAASYLGGSQEDYDVVKVNTVNWNYQLGVTDGNIDAWERIWTACQRGFTTNARYYDLEGKDTNGNLIKGKERILDIDNLIDYMITIFYTGNFDAPTSAFGGNRGPNNFYAIYKRNDKTKGFVFFNHDAEHSLMFDAVSPGTGLYENRVQPKGLYVTNLSGFHPQWLHHKLTENAEYRQRFADRAYLHFFNKGVFTPTQAETRFMKRAKEIDLAIIAESARWGDAKRGGNPYTRNQDWLPEIEKMQSEFFPFRTAIVVDQLTNAKLYTNTLPATFTIQGKSIVEDAFIFNNSATVSINTNQTGGLIYITTDGSDPRDIGGAVSKTAQLTDNGMVISFSETTLIRSRVKRGNEWSAISQVRLIRNYEDYNRLKVTELHYWPADSIIGNDTVSENKFEFVEIKNVGSHAVDLSRLKFYTAIDFGFNKNDILFPNDFYVIASSSKWFFERYGRAPSAVYKKAFSNSGEVVTILSDDGRIVFGFDYSAQNSWYAETASTGYSMASAHVYPIDDPKDNEYWKVSSYMHGSPFYDDNGFPLDQDEIASITDGMLVYPNPTRDLLFLKINDESVVDVEIYNLNGKMIFKQTIRENSIVNLRQLYAKPGILLVKLNGNGESIIRKVIYQP